MKKEKTRIRKKKFQVRRMKSKGKEKSIDIKELMCFGMEQKRFTYSAQKEEKNQINS